MHTLKALSHTLGLTALVLAGMASEPVTLLRGLIFFGGIITVAFIVAEIVAEVEES